jgi:PleD family two-component response regulator
VEVVMNAMGDRRILIVEDDQDWYEIIAEVVQGVLRDVGMEADYEVMHARDEPEALNLLDRHSFTLVSMDINLSNVSEGTHEGLDLLESLFSAPDTCSIIVSGEVKPEYILNGFQKYNILRFIRKAPWDDQELGTTVKSILLYADALGYLRGENWERAAESWEEACQGAPELRKKFQDVGKLVERANTHRVTGLPTGGNIDSKLKDLLKADEQWGILYIKVEDLEAYYETYGHVEGDSALKTVALFLQDQAGPTGFVGYADRNLFMVVVEDSMRARSLQEKLLDNFHHMYSRLYSNWDLDPHGVVNMGLPELKLAIRLVSDKDGPFADIREISRKGSGSD